MLGTVVAENATVCAHLDQPAHLSWSIRELRHEQYDDLTFTPLVESPIGTYKYLNYSAWVVAAPTTPGVGLGGIANKSPPNAALRAVDVQTLAGRTPSFTVLKPYKSFSLLDFYFGCVLRTDEGTVNEATQ